MSEPIVLSDIPFEVDIDAMVKRLRVGENGDDVARVTELARQAEAVARPKSVYRMGYIDSKESHAVVVDGTRFESRVLRVNLEDAHRLFPFAATCGRELYEWAESIDDMLEQYWASEIMESALRAAFDALKQEVTRRFALSRVSLMSPGSLADWPIQQQRPLFDLIGDVRSLVGVELTDSMLMVPVKSLSGVMFPLEIDFESCQLCPRDPCSGRRAPYDPELYERRYAQSRPEATGEDGTTIPHT